MISIIIVYMVCQEKNHTTCSVLVPEKGSGLVGKIERGITRHTGTKSGKAGHGIRKGPLKRQDLLYKVGH